GKGVFNYPLAIFPISGTFNPADIPFPPPSWLVSPSSGVVLSEPTHMILFDAMIHGDWAIAESAFLHLILPVVTLTYGVLAGIIRFLRAGMMDNRNQEYVKTARAKGVPEKTIIKKHIRKNAIIPTVTVLGLLFASLLGGVVLIEDVFDYPGMGLLGVNAVTSYSIYGVMGVTLVFGLVLVTANLIVDIVYAFLDPRIRY
ncbi:MAG: ABC transporter permease, partial [Thermoplasmata archaeon]